MLFLITTTLTGRPCWTQVRKSPSCMVSEPSPVKTTTCRPGKAACAPMAYGRPAAIEQLVPLKENICPRRVLICRAAQVVTVPESPHTIASPASASFSAQAGTCGCIGVSVLVPRSAISAHHSRVPCCAFSRNDRSSFRVSSGSSRRSVARASPHSPTSAG